MNGLKISNIDFSDETLEQRFEILLGKPAAGRPPVQLDIFGSNGR